MKDNNRVLIGLVFVLIVAGAGWYFLKAPKTSAPDNANAPKTALGAEIALAEGAVEYKESNGDWKRATANTTLKEGDSVEVVGTGKAVINFDDGSAVRLNNGSSVTLTSLDPTHVVVTNNKGYLYSRVAKSDSRQFEVKAGAVTYQSLGTAYKTVNEDKLKGVEVYESKVKILGATDKEILVDQGSKYYLVNASNKKVEKTIAKIDTKELSKDEFTMWNKTQDLKVEEYKDEMGVLANDYKDDTTTPAPATPSIVLTGYSAADGVKLSWKVNGLNVSNGFKIVKSLEMNPVYPGDSYVYLDNANVRSYLWELGDGRTYYFRVCQYLGGSCGKYSNNVKIKAPPSNTGSVQGVTSIRLVASGAANVSWSTVGYSKEGYKLVWSKNVHPTYPTRSGDQYAYYSDPKTNWGTINDFDGDGVYYARVCEYLGGKCGVYSNEISISF